MAHSASFESLDKDAPSKAGTKHLAGKFDDNEQRRNLQIEAAAHVRVQGEVDRMAAGNRLPEPALIDFILWLHRAFYRDAPDEMLRTEVPMANS